MFQESAHNIEYKERTKDVLLEENISFESLLLPDPLLKSLQGNGFHKPSPIQLKALPVGRCGFDLIMKSKSGTGKTLVFSIIAVESVDIAINNVQVLILVPTREIAVQIESVIRNIGGSTEGLQVASFIGGLPLEDDLKKLKNCHIAIGSPGRIKHLIKIGALKTKTIHLMILDEADKLMDDSFRNDINHIYNGLPARKQVIASSATYPDALHTFLTKYMLSPVHIDAEIETPVLLGLKQFVLVVNTPNLNAVQIAKAKNESLVQLLSRVTFAQCLVFSNYQTRAESVSNFLKQNQWDCSFISAAQKQSKRLEAINDLKGFKSRILISTDLTSRGIDAPNVDLVVNYDVPRDAVTYLHRMGRAGRFGSSGICINLTSQGSELTQLRKILGSISAGLGISKLPPFDENDVWKLEYDEFEQIYGLESAVNELETKQIKDEVLSLKTEMVIENSEDTNTDPNESPDALLQSASASNVENGEVPELDDEKKKRKRTPDSGKNVLHMEKKKTDDPDKTLCKNKALLNVTKLLFSTDVESDDVEDVDAYLEVLREVSIKDKTSNTAQNLVNSTSAHEEPQHDIEDLFTIAYSSTIGGNQKWYRHFIKEYETFIAHCEKEADEDDDDFDEADDEEGTYDEDYEMGDFESPEDETSKVIANRELQWIPVVKNKEANEVSNAHNDQYVNVYQEVSDNLWHNGLTFEDVPSFDEWYYQWQQQLLSVRNYVQQNIYVEEMSKYQKSRRGQ